MTAVVTIFVNKRLMFGAVYVRMSHDVKVPSGDGFVPFGTKFFVYLSVKKMLSCRSRTDRFARHTFAIPHHEKLRGDHKEG